jgi:anti-sigma B factor antagonist
MLVSKYLTAFRKGGCLKLLHLTARSDELLRLARLIDVFEVFETEDQAIASFGQDPPRT